MGLLDCGFYWGWWVWGFFFVLFVRVGVFVCFGGCVFYLYILCFAKSLLQSLSLGIYLFPITTVLLLSVLAPLAWVLQPWQEEWFWAMQSDCSSVILKNCPRRSARCGCVSMWVCQFVTTFLELTFWTCPLRVLWLVLWRAFGAQTGFLLDETNLRDVFLEYSYCPSVASVYSVRGTWWGLEQSVCSLLPVPQRVLGATDPQHWFPLWYHSCIRLQCLLMETWLQANGWQTPGSCLTEERMTVQIGQAIFMKCLKSWETRSALSWDIKFISHFMTFEMIAWICG